MATDSLETLVDRLERLAAGLRETGLAPERAAALAEECAVVAAEAGAELDRRVRAADALPAPAGQLALDS